MQGVRCNVDGTRDIVLAINVNQVGVACLQEVRGRARENNGFQK